MQAVWKSEGEEEMKGLNKNEYFVFTGKEDRKSKWMD